MNDLDDYCEAVEYDLAVFKEREPWRIDSSTFPAPPAQLATEKLLISCGEKLSDWISYGNRNDCVSFYASKNTYRKIGFLVFAVLFAPKHLPVELHINHSRSHIKKLVLDRGGLEPNGWLEGLYLHPQAFGYVSKSAAKYPFENNKPSRLEPKHDVFDLPRLIVNSSEPSVQSVEYWKARDNLCFCSNFIGTALFAELLLDISCEDAEGDEYHLFSHPSFCAVAPGSAEISFWLPGSFGWPDDLTLD